MTIAVSRDSAGGPDADNLNPDFSGDWAEFAEGLRFLALKALGDRSAADDVAQETILRALRTSKDSTALIRNRAAFIHGIARHVIADALRRNYRTLPVEDADAIPTSDRNALDAMISDEERRRVRSAIQKLPKPERSLLVLSFVRGMTSPEIAEKLGESADVIRKRKSRAVQNLREVFFAL